MNFSWDFALIKAEVFCFSGWVFLLLRADDLLEAEPFFGTTLEGAWGTFFFGGIFLTEALSVILLPTRLPWEAETFCRPWRGGIAARFSDLLLDCELCFNFFVFKVFMLPIPSQSKRR